MSDENQPNYRIINDIVKVYPNMVKIIIYHNSYKLKLDTSVRRNPDGSRINSTDPADNIERSLRRSKTAVKDIIICNSFDYFCTFTFDKRKHDRYDVNHCKLVMSMWLNRQRKHSPALKYLVVPELHKDGALHFHALFADYHGKLKELPHKTQYGRSVYNISSWRAGRISSAVPIDGNNAAIAEYMLKQYLIKDMPTFSGSKRYWCSQGLKRPQTHVNGVLKFNLDNVIQKFKPTYMNEFLEVQHHVTNGAKIDDKKKEILLNLPV